jgi:hypothetical protein
MPDQYYFGELDPACIFFTHSRIRATFSGCSKRVEETLEELVSGMIQPGDLPQITVVVSEGKYFSLNNRRLFVLKKCKELGLLADGMIKVRMKAASRQERERYHPDRCALVAKLALK